MTNKLTNRPLVKELLVKGLPHAAIADIAKCSIASVSKVAGEADLKRKQNKQYVVLSDEEWDEILAEIAVPGYTNMTLLARKYGVSRAAIYKRLKSIKG